MKNKFFPIDTELNKISNSEHVSRYTSQLKIVGSSNDPISGMVGEHEALMEGFIPFWSHVSNDASTYLNEVQFSGPSAAAEPAILPTPRKKNEVDRKKCLCEHIRNNRMLESAT